MQQAIEMVGNDGLAFCIAWQPAGMADELGDETASRLVGRQNALVDAEQMQPFKIEVAGLQQAHDLQTFSVAAVQLQA